jgi:hypothetical protein
MRKFAGNQNRKFDLEESSETIREIYNNVYLKKFDDKNNSVGILFLICLWLILIYGFVVLLMLKVEF